MDNFSKEASEVEEVPYEELTTPGSATTSPCMDTNRSANTDFIDTFTQRMLPMVNASKRSDSTYINALNQTMSTADKVDSWFTSTPAAPSQSSTSRPNTRDTAMSSLASDQSQLLNHKVRHEYIEPCVTSASKQAPFLDSTLGSQGQLLLTQMDGGTEVPGPSAAGRCELSTSRLGTRDLFFDSVPNGPNRLPTSRWDTKAPALVTWDSARGQGPEPPWNDTETTYGIVERFQGSPRPRLSLQIPKSSIASENFRSAPQMATHTGIFDQEAADPHTTNTLGPGARLSSPLHGSQPHATCSRNVLNPAARPFQTKFTGPRAPARRNNHTVILPAAASHTNSRTWTSDFAVQKKEWQRVEESLGRMNLLRSSVVPKTMREWLAHQRDRTKLKMAWEQRKLEDMNRSLRNPRLPPGDRPVKIRPAFRGRAFGHKNYSPVLSCESIWTHTYEPTAKRPDPLWPCAEEMKEEGDERNTSGFRRFPALPRVPGNPTVQYKHKAFQAFLPFDAIWKLPTKESAEAGNEQSSPEEIEQMEGYLGRSLLDALDCITEDNI